MLSFEEVLNSLPRETYWESLPTDHRPLLLYGSGNGADKIIDACQRYGIDIDGIFASDGFVRDRTFHDMKVLSYSEVREIYGDEITVLLCFGTTVPEVMSFLETLDKNHNMIIPEVPLYGGGIFDSSHLAEKKAELEAVYGMLSDDTSRELFRDVLLFRMTGKLKYLKRCENMRSSLTSLVVERDIKTALDGGAFKGDSAEDMISAMEGIEHIIACEPDPSTFKKLSLFAESTDGVVAPVMKALGNREHTSTYVSSGSRGSGQGGRNRRAKNVEIEVSTVDRLVGDGSIDFLKLDVEGSEAEAIAGADKTIKKCRPAMAVSLYHKTDDLTELPLLLSDKLRPCRMYLRRPKCIPMWDLTLYVIPE